MLQCDESWRHRDATAHPARKSFDFYGSFYYLVNQVNLNGDKDGQRKSPLGSIGTYTGIGIELATFIIVFLLAGRYLDSRWGTEPWLLILGAVLGFAAGFYNMFKSLSGLSNPGDRKRTGR